MYPLSRSVKAQMEEVVPARVLMLLIDVLMEPALTTTKTALAHSTAPSISLYAALTSHAELVF